jgi:hypothetical protein
METCAIHPSGYQLAIACSDKISVNLIFEDGLREINTIMVSHAHLLKYSRGGHILFVVDRTGLKIYNAYTLKLLTDPIKLDGPKICDLVCSDLDRAFALISNTGTCHKYEMPSFKEIMAIEDPEEEKED